ncbi:type II secretion system major pseudopilin GspG [Pacificimonas sp. WHA3]|uniref:Type II secretion system major pseudopilin GspG n=1 Tax=Pacificimonas pallii TaxID=2827236 RepID=A0ABS6SHB2_9SPHN|nr:type II secretion system major pseudopilin GspG [Pacificimonas pallii]MBV7257812.1 type II secretion system major pseudopilin GspG [Pacificimonas pallii]
MHKPEDRSQDEDGFTLVELMVVIAILGLLTTFVVLNVLPAQGVAEREKARADIAVIEQALQMYRIDNRSFPSTADGLAALQQAPAGLARPERYRAGGYVQRLPTDPWGNAYLYQFPGQRGQVDIFSYGADGVPGGEDENADIGNWQG